MLSQVTQIDVFVIYNEGRFNGFVPRQALWRHPNANAVIKECARRYVVIGDWIYEDGKPFYRWWYS